MDASDVKQKIDVLKEKLSSYKALLSANKEIYDCLQARIYTICMEITSGISTFEHHPEMNASLRSYINRVILEGLKKKVLSIIEDNVILEHMIQERTDELETLRNSESDIQLEVGK